MLCYVVTFVAWILAFSVCWLNLFSEMTFFNSDGITFVISSIRKSLEKNDKMSFFGNMNIKIRLFIKNLNDIENDFTDYIRDICCLIYLMDALFLCGMIIYAL